MDEKRILADCEPRLKGKITLLPETPFNASNQEVLEKTDEVLNEVLEEQVKPKIEHPNQSNPIYKKLMNFKNAKIGDKWSIKDLLR